MTTKDGTWMPEIGETIEGILIEKLDNIGKYNNKLYKIKSDNKIINIWGKKHLDALMQVTRIGDKIKLTYTGLEQVNEFKMKKYELEIINGL